MLAGFRVDNKISGSLALGVCLLIILAKVGMEFSADHRASREFYSLFGRKFGRWKPLPPIVGVTVKYFSEVASITPGSYSWGIWNTAPKHYEKLVVMLSVQDKPVGIIIGNFPLGDVNEALDFAHNIAEEFAVPVHTFLPANQFKPL